MKNKAFIWLSILFLLSWCWSHAQPGHPYLSHFKPDNNLFDNQNFAIIEDQYGAMVMANRKGILTFDGNNWGFIKTGSTPRSLALDSATGRIFVGAKNEYGYLEPNDNGEYTYINLSGRGTYFGYYTQTLIAEGYAWFCSELSLARVSLTNPKDQYKWVATETHPFGGIYVSENRLHLIKMGFGVFTMDKNKQTKVQKANDLTNIGLLKQLTLTNEKSLLLSIENQLYLLNKGVPIEYTCDASEFLNENTLTAGKKLSNDEVALGTKTGGIVKIKVSNGKILESINFENGLPDDEVLSLGLDRFKGLWVAHEYGLSRIDFDIPVSTYHTYPGLIGSITNTYEFKGQLYVGTTNGLYILDTVKDFREIEVSVKKRIRERANTEQEKNLRKNYIQKITIQQNIIPTEHDDLESNKKKKKNSRKKKQEEKNEEPIKNALTIETASTKKQPNLYKTIIELQKIKVLNAISFSFIKIEGFDEKVKVAQEINGRFFTGTSNGLYEIIGHKAVKVFENLSILDFLVFDSKNQLMAGTSTGIHLFDFSNDTPESKSLLSTEYPIHNLLIDPSGTLWLGGENQLYVIKDFDPQKGFLPIEIPFLNSYSEQISIRLVNDRVGIFFSDGLYFADLNKKILVPDSALILEKKRQLKVIYGTGNETWVYNGNEWSAFNLSRPGLEGLSRFIEVFDQVQLIQSGSSGDLWITDKNNKIYKLKSDKSFRLDSSFRAHIDKIKDKENLSLPLSNLKLDYGNNGLSFYFSAPFYISNSGVQFSYYLKGISKEWSEWSGNSIVDFPFLPDGEYEFRIRAKNVLGQITETEKLAFEILPPYWRTWWFYILEVVFFSGLLFLSVFFNTSNESSFLSKSLTFLTLIVFIEAIHISISVIFDLEFDDSPVLQFLMDVSLALLISPFEKVLTRVIRRRSIANE